VFRRFVANTKIATVIWGFSLSSFFGRTHDTQPVWSCSSLCAQPNSQAESDATLTMGQPPTAPPCNEEYSSIPVVTATAFDVSATPVAKVVTTTYEDGRQVTVTEFQQPGMSTAAGPAAAPLPPAPAPAAAPGAKFCERGILRRDLGARPVMITCGHCNHTGKTKANSSPGACTFISTFALIFLFLPLFWLPFVCPSVSASTFHL